jgi:SpoVK/Ycf46/Vps4 family AAA+-type ATPase
MVQMESFSGLFICATNFMESFDSAAFRRFAMKIKFTFLKPDQSWSLLLQILEEINHPIEPDSCLAERLKQSIRRLDNLTPGDFAAVKQRFDMMGTAFSAPDFVAALEQDCRGKGLGQKRRIGFIRA